MRTATHRRVTENNSVYIIYTTYDVFAQNEGVES